MARPQVFISSTYYDLKHIRASLDGFVKQLGFDPILSEKGKIAYDPDIPLDESCYREASAADIFVLIIGGRYGSAASEESLEKPSDFYNRYESITKKEYEAATKNDIPIYILVESSVDVEYRTYRKNRTNETIEYAHVESINVFKLLDEILGRRRNNPIQQFEHHTDIEEWLREQWAGLFRELINRRSEKKQLSSLSDKVSELANINSSLQRYLEEVVSRVSNSPEDAHKIIKEENQRLKLQNRQREFGKGNMIRSLIEDYDVSIEEAEKIYTEASTIDDIAFKCAPYVGTDADRLIAKWKVNSHFVDEINAAREILGLTSLDFDGNTNT